MSESNPSPSIDASLGAIPAASPDGVASCPPGTDPDLAGPVGQDRPLPSEPIVGGMQAVMVPRIGTVIALDTQAATTWGLDVCTNTWRLMHPRREPTVLARRLLHLVYVADLDLVVAMPEGGHDGWAYSVAENTWTALTGSAWAVHGDWRYPQDLVYDPVTRLIVVRDSTWTGDLATYDVAANSWERVPVRGDVPRDLDLPGPAEVGSAMAYDASVDRFVLAMVPVDGSDGATWVFDRASRRWRQRTATPPPLPFGWVGTVVEVPVTYDAAAQRTVMMGAGGDESVALYDARADRWEVRKADPEWVAAAATWAGYQLVYDPVNERVVVLGGAFPVPPEEATEARRTSPAEQVWAYDASADEWTLLVPPT